MAFNFIAFFDSNHIHYATSGPNVSRGHVAVHCPFCGSADKSQHMSVSVNGGGWHCWRNENHSGKSPVGLVQALLACSWERAQGIVGESLFIPEDFLGTVKGLVAAQREPPRKAITLPPDFKPFDGRRSSQRYVNYLKGRDFTSKQIGRMTDRYGLHYATEGKFRGRIIFPVTFERKLITYTGRTIYPDIELRYKTLSYDPELEEIPAVGPISDYLLFYDLLMKNAMDADTLIFCEGPFDALKVNVIGRAYGIASTCFFTSSPSRGQIDIAGDLISRYKRRYLLLDQGTLARALRSQMEMSTLVHRVLTLPKAFKDPGLLTQQALLKIVP